MLTNIFQSLFRSPLSAAGLTQALGSAAGIMQGFGLVAVFGGLMGAAVSALSERHLAGVIQANGLVAVFWGLIGAAVMQEIEQMREA
jgi:hypothetical protein